MAGYDERLRVPGRWWALAGAGLATLWVAYAVVLPGWLAGGLTAVGGLVVGGVLWGYGAARVRVDAGELRAGRARVPVDVLGEVRALSAEQTAWLAGPGADHRAFLLLRPYLRRAVWAEVIDPADPTPYWLVSSRRPEALAAAVSGARQSG